MNDINVKLSNRTSNDESFGPIITDGYFANCVAEQMKKSDESMTDAIVNKVFSNATSILNQCPNPNGRTEFKKTGIVIGKVQSGKTSNFIALLALAFDNGYNLAVVIGGNTTELLTQNVNRIKSSFNVPVNKLVVLHSKDNHSQITPEKIKNFINNGKKVLIVSLKSPQVKNKKHLTRISELFDDPVMANETTIIIDDEGDQATLNSKVYSKDEDITKHVAQTYKVAVDIKNKIKRHCFISITATPQANILIKTSDYLSPDFGTLIYPGRGYCGLSIFHGDEQDKYVKVIPNDEDTLLDSDGGIPETFIVALSAFYVSNAIRISRGDDGVHSMLIHPSIKKFDHSKVQEKVDRLISEWQSIAKLGINDISYQLGLKKDLLKAYAMYADEDVVLRPFDELEPTIIKSILNSSNTLVFNSDQKNARADADLYTTRIYLGGNILDRGITIKGLSITYIIRRAKGYSNVDNTEQRARWFGYKNVPDISDYIDICRVWATDAIKKDFSSINESDEEMWSSIERNIKNGKSFKELPRYFILQHDASHRLKLTRSNVAKTQDVSWTEWKPQDYFVNDKSYAEFNMNLLEQFRNKYKGVIKDYKGVNKHYFVYDVNFKEFLDDVLCKFYFNENDSIDIDLLYKLYGLIEDNNMDNTIDLVWLRIYDYETRKILDDGTIQQFYRGRDLKVNEFGEYNYLGDRHTCDERPEKIQIQIHYIKASNLPGSDFYSPAISIFIPEIYAFKLVGRSDG